jgi:hypothetical protein
MTGFRLDDLQTVAQGFTAIAETLRGLFSGVGKPLRKRPLPKSTRREERECVRRGRRAGLVAKD